MAPAKKRAHKCLNLLDKIRILDEIKTGKSGKQISLKYGIGAATVSDIKRNSKRFKK